MSGKIRINKELILNKILPPLGLIATAVGAVTGTLAFVGFVTTPDEAAKARPRLSEYTRIPGDVGTYRISGPDQIVVKQGDYQYTFNYEAQQVIVEGDDNNFITTDFKDFSNPEMISDIKSKACTISTSFTTAVDNYFTTYEPNENSREWAEGERAITQSFTADNCPLPGSIPYVR